MVGKPRHDENGERSNGEGPTGMESRREAPTDGSGHRQRRRHRSRRRRGFLKAAGAVLGAGVFGHLGGRRSHQIGDGGSSDSERGGPQRSSDHSLLFWNTWLLDGILGISAKPQYEERADEIGRTLDSIGYDIVALCEVFDADERRAVRSGFDDKTEGKVGPGEGLLEVSSGLYTLLPDGSGREFVSSDETVYSEDGQEVRDADALARKGVLHTEIDVGPGNVDLFSTHLLAGGGLGFIETLYGWMSPDVPDRELREAQVGELTEFVKERTKDENITVVVGDFNIDAGGEEYESTIGGMMEELDLYDGWLRHGDGGSGATDTAGLTAGCDIDEDGGEPYRCVGDDRGRGDRIDYIFVEEPKPSHSFELDVSSVERATFWRGKGNQERFYADGNGREPNYLSDHMALELHFDAVPK